MKTPVLFMFFGGLLLFFGGGDGPNPQPVFDDVLAECYEVDRQAKADVLSEAAGREFNSDSEKADWINQEIRDAQSEALEPFADQVAEAIVAGQLAEFAEGLR